MFLPIGDRYNPEGFTPWVNYALIAANVAVYLLITLPLSSQGVDPRDPLALEYLQAVASDLPPGTSDAMFLSQLTGYDLIVYAWGFKPARPEAIDLFSSMFLHGGFMHLAGNMLFLWIYGDNVEFRLGRGTYLVVYLATGIVATLTFAMFAASSATPLVGASGAISGVLGLYFIFFPKNEVKMLIALFPFIVQAFWIRARWVLGFYVVVDNILPFVTGMSSNVAYGAHLGGFFAGLGVAWAVESGGGTKPAFASSAPSPSLTPPQESLFQSPAHVVPSPPETLRDPRLPAIEARLERGEIEAARREVDTLDLATASRLAPRHLYTLAREMAARGEDHRAGRLLRRALGTQRSPHEQATLHLALGELRLAQGQPAAAWQHLLTVLDLVPEGPVRARAETALRALE